MNLVHGFLFFPTVLDFAPVLQLNKIYNFRPPRETAQHINIYYYYIAGKILRQMSPGKAAVEKTGPSAYGEERGSGLHCMEKEEVQDFSVKEKEEGGSGFRSYGEGGGSGLQRKGEGGGRFRISELWRRRRFRTSASRRRRRFMQDSGVMKKEEVQDFSVMKKEKVQNFSDTKRDELQDFRVKEKEV
jgi:hypothetical protein